MQKATEPIFLKLGTWLKGLVLAKEQLIHFFKGFYREAGSFFHFLQLCGFMGLDLQNQPFNLVQLDSIF